MSEQPNNPKDQQKPPKKKNTLSERIILDGGKPDVKPAGSPSRKKPSISISRAQVDMPGKLKESKTEKKPASPVKKPTPATVKPKPVGKGQPSKGAAPPKNIPKKPSKPITKKPSPKTGSKGKAVSTKKGGTSTKKKQVTRSRTIPPKIGARRGYRPSLAFRLRFPVFLIAFAVCALALFFTFHKEVGPVGRYVSSALTAPPAVVTIEPGMSAKAVSLVLKNQGVVQDDQAMLQYFTENNLATTLRSGTFMMEKGMAHESIARALSAKADEIIVGVSPSFTLKTIDRYLENRGYAKRGEFLKAAELLKDEYSLTFTEGWLLSGEYKVPKEGAASALVQAMFDATLEAVQPHLGSEQVSLWGLEQILIIASMIQAETQNVGEMPLIASVIYNRLEAGEPLGIDATTRYELNDWENPIPKKALETKTPYNTRRKVGLPPTGICAPSKAAVEAAMYPLESPYFYYLHGLDKRLHPAITYDEHKQNIKAYR